MCEVSNVSIKVELSDSEDLVVVSDVKLDNSHVDCIEFAAELKDYDIEIQNLN